MIVHVFGFILNIEKLHWENKWIDKYEISHDAPLTQSHII